MASLQQKLLSEELGDRMRAMNESRSLTTAERFELICLAKDDRNSRVRYDAISQMSGLGQHDLDKSLEILSDRLLNDPEIDVRAAAADSIGALKLTAAFEDLIRAYKQTNDWIMQFSVIAALGELGDPRGFDILAKALQHNNDLVKIAAIGSLGDLGDPKALDLLLPFIDNSDWQVRYRLVQAFSQLGVAQAKAALQKLSQDPHEQVAGAATSALKNAN